MGEFREAWVLVRVLTRGDTGRKFCDPTAFKTRNAADVCARVEGGRGRFLVHVRPKPAGAPARYADWLERFDWERGILPDPDRIA